MLRRTFVIAALLGCSAALAACSGDRNAVRDLAMAAGITGGEPKPAPDFVSRTRSAEPEYLPIGRDAPARPLRAKGSAAVADAEGDLARTRSTNEVRARQARRAAATPPPSVPPAPPPEAPAE